MKTPDLFEMANPPKGPLAERMRPQSLQDFCGQTHLVGEGKPWRKIILCGEIPGSIILYGPAGCGKTTLARIISHHTKTQFVEINATTSNLKELRETTTNAQTYQKLHGEKTILFVDEIHHFNKSQQDILLPWVEKGTLLLIGATTENPFFSLNGPLLSRSQLLTLQTLSIDEIEETLGLALLKKEGLRATGQTLSPQGARILAQNANGDPRRALQWLELASNQTPHGEIISTQLLEEISVGKIRAYDRQSDQHYDITSAFCKSLRGSDPDAALYWATLMLENGEDFRYILRRLIIHASEDVGLADPHALTQAVNALHTLEFVGMPEGRFALTQAILYVALAPKSHSVTRAMKKAREEVLENPPQKVPNPLRDSHYAGAAQLGHGEGYLFPHDYPHNFVEQNYLENPLKIYTPDQNENERKLRENLEKRQKKEQGSL